MLAPVVMSSVLDEPDAMLDGVNVALAPVGRPVAESATVSPVGMFSTTMPSSASALVPTGHAPGPADQRSTPLAR